MTDEEKKAIEFVKSELQDEKIARNDYQSLTGLYGNLEIETVLNIIKKQSKEIEELKEKYSKKLIEFQKEREWYEKNYISKDKIKAKIEYYEKIDNPVGKRVLQSLLEKE